MSHHSWLGNLFARKTPKTRGPARISSARKRGCKPLTLEVLEDRTLPSGTPAATLQLIPSAIQGSSAVTLPLDSFHFRFHHTSIIGGSSGGGSGTENASFDALDVTTTYNADSPQLLAQLTQAKAYDKAFLTLPDAGNGTVAVWSLATVLVTEDKVTNNSAGLPAEELQFAFDAIRQANSTGSASWSLLTNNPDDGLGLPAGVTLSPLPGPPTTNLTLQLASANATAATFANVPAATINLNAFQFGFHNTVTSGSASGSAGAGKPSFDDLDVTAALSNASPALFNALVTGSHYDTATLTENNARGQPIAVWVLGFVFVTDDALTGTDGGSAYPPRS
jgi:type VI protein secretion system component Hcp